MNPIRKKYFLEFLFSLVLAVSVFIWWKGITLSVWGWAPVVVSILLVSYYSAFGLDVLRRGLKSLREERYENIDNKQ
jgi:O-antigen ligase